MSTKEQSSGETNTFALTMLVLFTAFVLITAFGGDGEVESSDSSTETVTAASETPAAAETDTDVSGELAGIPVDGTTTVENRMVTRPDGQGDEQVITFETPLRAADMAVEYQTWIDTNGYTIEKEHISDRAASLAATNGNQVLIIMISYLSSQDASYVEIINYRRS